MTQPTATNRNDTRQVMVYSNTTSSPRCKSVGAARKKPVFTFTAMMAAITSR